MEAQRAVNDFERQTKRKPFPSYQAPSVDDGRPAEAANEPFLRSRTPTVLAHSSKEGYWVAGSNDCEPPRRREGVAVRIIEGWWPEVLCCGLSIASFVTLAVVLQYFDGKPLPDWPSGITINTIVASLATIARTAFIIPVSEGLSQCKWNWFKKKPRPLQDFEVFDHASRSLFGILTLLGRTKGWSIGILSALLLISGIATSTHTQSAVTYPTRNMPLIGEENAVAWKAASFLDTATNMSGLEDLLWPIERSIVQAAYTLPSETIPIREPQCLASNCTCPQFGTLAACYNRTDVSHLLELENDNATFTLTLPNGVNATVDDKTYTLSLPNGVNAEVLYMGKNAAPRGAAMADATSLSYNGTQEKQMNISNYFVIHSDVDASRAAEVLLYWCVKTYEPKVENNILNMGLLSSRTEAHHGGKAEWYKLSNATVNAMYLTSADDEGTAYWMDGDAAGWLAGSVSKFMRGSSTDYTLIEIKSPLDMVFHGLRVAGDKYLRKANQEGRMILTDEEKENAWWETIDGQAQNMANAITNSIINERNASNIVNGTAWQRQVYVQIRWSWLAFLAAQIFLSVLVLVLAIIETVRADLDVIKSSNLAALFAISAEEKAGLEAEGEPLVGKDDDRWLLPSGIAGDLRRREGKWVLGGARE